MLSRTLIRKLNQYVKTSHNRFYHENIVDHYENPRNVGSLDKKKTSVGTGLVGAPACGDVMKLQFEVDESGKIIDAKFKTFGCGSAIGKFYYVFGYINYHKQFYSIFKCGYRVD